MTSKPLFVAVFYFIVFIRAAHLFAPPGYRWTYHKISDLASQGHPYKWIMQTGFIGFGLLLTAGCVFHFNKNRKLFYLVPVAVYGLSILISGIFCAAPISTLISFSARDAYLHSIFATLAGISMSAGIFLQVVLSRNNHDRRIRVFFLLSVGAASGIFGLAENHIVDLDRGIIQRILYLVGLAWMIYEERVIL